MVAEEINQERRPASLGRSAQGTYVRLRNPGILPVWAVDQAFQMAFYLPGP